MGYGSPPPVPKQHASARTRGEGHASAAWIGYRRQHPRTQRPIQVAGRMGWGCLNHSRGHFTPTRNAIGLSRPTASAVAVAHGRLSPWRSVLPPPSCLGLASAQGEEELAARDQAYRISSVALQPMRAGGVLTFAEGRLVGGLRVLPSPLRGGVGGGGKEAWSPLPSHPTPNPSPSRGEGTRRASFTLRAPLIPDARPRRCSRRDGAPGRSRACARAGQRPRACGRC